VLHRGGKCEKCDWQNEYFFMVVLTARVTCTLSLGRLETRSREHR
jgi:uncharacterized protein (UPF0212 family)